MSRTLFYLPVSSRYEARRMGDVKVTDAFLRGSECSQPIELYPNQQHGNDGGECGRAVSFNERRTG